eukprot:m.146169 g.146169  ORF g.146169 m.146169 type:complete len:897 (-) comp14965_c0_seq2:3853-6543(-)
MIMTHEDTQSSLTSALHAQPFVPWASHEENSGQDDLAQLAPTVDTELPTGPGPMLETIFSEIAAFPVFGFPDRKRPRTVHRVVGFIGTEIGPGNDTTRIINNIVGCDAFQGFRESSDPDEEQIESFLDDERRICFLKLLCRYETIDELARQTDIETPSSEMCQAWFEQQDEQIIRKMMFLFSCCKELIIIQPSSHIELHWIRIFRLLENARAHVKKASKENVSSSLNLSPGHCVPVLRFIVKPPATLGARVFEHNKLKQLRIALETQLRSALRRAHLASTDDRPNRNEQSWRFQTKLFVLPTGPFCFVIGDAVTNKSQGISTDDTSDRATLLLSLYGYNNNTNSDKTRYQASNQYQNAHLTELQEIILSGTSHAGNDFLTWLELASVHYDMLVSSKTNDEGEKVQKVLSMKLDSLSTFSNNLCSKELPHAVSQYKADLPNLYRTAEHQAALARALSCFEAAACGPALQRFTQQLFDDCELKWKNGHQLCEATSVSGSRCALPVHKLPGDSVKEGEDPPKPHHTGVNCVCSCACGRAQTTVEEPFLLGQANDYFLEEECCPQKIKSRAWFAVTTSDDNTHPTKDMSENKQGVTRSASSSLFDESALVELLQARGLGVDGGDSNAMANMKPEGAAGPDKSSSDNGSAAVSSTPCPAIKCCKVGQFADYNPTGGLENAGFLPGTNYLLPWDVIVPPAKRQKKSNDKASEQQNNKSQKGSSTKPVKSVWKIDKGKESISSDGVPNSIRCYFGYEYECPLGHRFIDATPDRRVQLSQSGYVKGTAHASLKSDMPLFVLCPSIRCARKTSLAQLSRVYLVTPPSPLKFGFAPRIQLRPGRSGTSRALIVHTGDATVGIEDEGIHSIQLPRIFSHDKKAIILPVGDPVMRQNMLLLRNPLLIE